MNSNPNKNLIIELLEEEISKLLYFMERHRRWGRHVEDNDLARKHRTTADIIKDVIENNQEIVEKLKGE